MTGGQIERTRWATLRGWMADGWLISWVLGVIFIATLIRSAFGFGEALVAVPLLALLIPVEVAAPLAVLVSITVAAVIVLEQASG